MAKTYRGFLKNLLIAPRRQEKERSLMKTQLGKQ